MENFIFMLQNARENRTAMQLYNLTGSIFLKFRPTSKDFHMSEFRCRQMQACACAACAYLLGLRN